MAKANRKYDIVILRVLSGSYEAIKSNFALIREKKRRKVAGNLRELPHEALYSSSKEDKECKEAQRTNWLQTASQTAPFLLP